MKGNYTSDLADALRNRLRYDELSGGLIWVSVDESYGRYWRRFNKNYAGKSAIWINNSRIPCVSLRYANKSHSIIASRVIWLLSYNEWPVGDVDHINHDPRDNRLSNLRCISHKDNVRYRKLPKNNTTGYKGVREKYKDRWQAYITVNRKQIYLGTFGNPEDAAKAYDKAVEEHFGVYGIKNFS